MKVCDSWLREWVAHGLDAAALAERLTMLGLEVESVSTVGEPLADVVAGRVVEVRPHPDARKLSLCQVDAGGEAPLGIVCGAANVRAGGVYPVALPGARLPGGLVIKPTRIRGEPSAGMLCSAAELGMEAASDGLLELDSDAAPGSPVAGILALGDAVLELSVTPNRADCLSVLGLAREVAASGAAELRGPPEAAVPPRHAEVWPVAVADGADCPRFAGRVLRGLRPDARTPLWMRERLRRCGIRPIHPVVDVTNYVMLELGQPLHAYDLQRLSGGISVRRGRKGETLGLLGGQEVRPGPDLLVIADDAGAIGLAGIMGGSRTAVTAGTRDVFLESAFFSPAAILGRARTLGLHTEASLRFERGVDPTGQRRAVERATELLMAIAGGEPGQVVEVTDAARLPARRPVILRRQRLARVLGAEIPDADVAAVLARLGMDVTEAADGWSAQAPAARFDIEREEDLIEEVARVHGYQRIGETAGSAPMHPASAGDTARPLLELGATLVARGYQEAITYSFVAPALGEALGAVPCEALRLTNPISGELAVMRQSLWPGLVRSAGDNVRRQQPRVRLFEIGTRFRVRGADDYVEEQCVAGIAVGSRLPEQWDAGKAAVDVFDVKSDVESLLALARVGHGAAFEPAEHRALHPGRSACIRVDGAAVGWIGELHPALARSQDLPRAVVFEIATAALLERRRPGYRPPSVFPAVRRDLAVVVDRGIAAARLIAAVTEAGGALLREAVIFDIYTGPQVGATEKSVAIGLILQDPSRTLADDDAGRVVADIQAALERLFRARIRQGQ